MENQESTTTSNFNEELKKCFFFKTLIPASNESNMHQAIVKFDSYSHLLYAVKDLLQIAVHTLHNDGSENSGLIEDPAFHLTSILEIAIQLLPCPEGEALDLLHQFYLELEKNQKQEENLKKSQNL
ncbi:hypothetical protein [Flavobacterium tegetincola]|uniref:hypothetical protein n=1 Tax=Flavobacterium tegetincola TaxID=150172 RepID=UPI0004098068|nr:hypothetical protein [Flavobacterium tegetincola]